MVADPGSFTGSAEAKYYIQNLEVYPTFTLYWCNCSLRLHSLRLHWVLSIGSHLHIILPKCLEPQIAQGTWHFMSLSRIPWKWFISYAEFASTGHQLERHSTSKCGIILKPLSTLQNATEIAPGMTICVNRAYGTIMGQNVTVISSGINAQSSALCTLEVLSCASHIKDFIFQGTSGFSAAVSICFNTWIQTTLVKSMMKHERCSRLCRAAKIFFNWIVVKLQYYHVMELT